MILGAIVKSEVGTVESVRVGETRGECFWKTLKEGENIVAESTLFEHMPRLRQTMVSGLDADRDWMISCHDTQGIKLVRVESWASVNQDAKSMRNLILSCVHAFESMEFWFLAIRQEACDCPEPQNSPACLHHLI